MTIKHTPSISAKTPSESKDWQFVVSGAGPYPSTWERILQTAGLKVSSLGRLRQCPDDAVLLVLPFLESSLQQRSEAFHDRRLEFTRIALMADAFGETEAFFPHLFAGGELIEESTTLPQIYLLEFERICHQLKYLLTARGTPSSWFFVSPFDGEEQVIERLEQRLGKIAAAADRVEQLIASSYEREIWRSGLMVLRTFVPLISRWMRDREPSKAASEFFESWAAVADGQTRDRFIGTLLDPKLHFHANWQDGFSDFTLLARTVNSLI